MAHPIVQDDEKSGFYKDVLVYKLYDIKCKNFVWDYVHRYQTVMKSPFKAVAWAIHIKIVL